MGDFKKTHDGRDYKGKVILAITSNCTCNGKPTSYFGLIEVPGARSVIGVGCSYKDQKDAIEDVRKRAADNGWEVIAVEKWGHRSKPRVMTRSTIGASYPTGGGVFLDCHHCGQSLYLSGKPLFNPNQCPGFDIKEIEALFRKAHTHKR